LVHAYKRVRSLAELGYASVAVGAFGRVIRGRERLSCAAVLCGTSWSDGRL